MQGTTRGVRNTEGHEGQEDRGEARLLVANREPSAPKHAAQASETDSPGPQLNLPTNHLTSHRPFPSSPLSSLAASFSFLLSATHVLFPTRGFVRLEIEAGRGLVGVERERE